MDNKKHLMLAISAGKIMLENGAETYRVEDTMTRILGHCNDEISEAFVTTTGLFVSVGSETIVKRITERTINLNKIALVNDLSRKIVNDKISIDEAFKILEDINNIKPYSFYLKTFITGLCCASFSYVFGGIFQDCINSFFVGIFLNIIIHFFKKRKVSEFLVTIIGGAVISLFTLLFLNIGIGKNIDMVIIGSIMPLVPGVGITNAIRDILEGDFLSGSGRIFDALIVAIAVATGVGTILKLWIHLFGGYIL